MQVVYYYAIQFGINVMLQPVLSSISVLSGKVFYYIRGYAFKTP